MLLRIISCLVLDMHANVSFGSGLMAAQGDDGLTDQCIILSLHLKDFPESLLYNVEMLAIYDFILAIHVRKEKIFQRCLVLDTYANVSFRAELMTTQGDDGLTNQCIILSLHLQDFPESLLYNVEMLAIYDFILAIYIRKEKIFQRCLIRTPMFHSELN